MLKDIAYIWGHISIISSQLSIWYGKFNNHFHSTIWLNLLEFCNALYDQELCGCMCH